MPCLVSRGLHHSLPARSPLITFRQQMSARVKPPNILVQVKVEGEPGAGGLLQRVRGMVSREMYVVYPILSDDLCQLPWTGHTALLVLQTQPPPPALPALAIFLQQQQGGLLDLSPAPALSSTSRHYRHVAPPDGEEEVTTEELTRILGEMGIKTPAAADTDTVEHSPGYLIGSSGNSQAVETLLSEVGERQVQQAELLLDFTGTAPPGPACLPVLTTVPPSQLEWFNSDLYLSSLKTAQLGRTAILVPALGSSQAPYRGRTPLPPGLAVIPRHQVAGRGRGGNTWLSPPGCLMFSIQVLPSLQTASLPQFCVRSRCPGPATSRPAPPSSNCWCGLCSENRRLSCTAQVGLAVVEAVYGLQPGLARAQLAIKWPNDIYYGGTVKLGGVVAESSWGPGRLTAVLGCGLNLDNALPTRSLNQLLGEAGLPDLAREILTAEIFNTLEQLIQLCETGQEDKVVVTAVDEFGYLMVRAEDGKLSSVMDDGNSFDMMEGLIKPKFN